MSEKIPSSSSHHHHHHHHHRDKHRLSRNKRLLRKIIWPIAIIFFLFLIFVTFFPDTYKELIDKYFHHKVMDYDMIPEQDRVSQTQQPRTIHWSECHEAVRV